jgi:hypothetical protein
MQPGDGVNGLGPRRSAGCVEVSAALRSEQAALCQPVQDGLCLVSMEAKLPRHARRGPRAVPVTVQEEQHVNVRAALKVLRNESLDLLRQNIAAQTVPPMLIRPCALRPKVWSPATTPSRAVPTTFPRRHGYEPEFP